MYMKLRAQKIDIVRHIGMKKAVKWFFICMFKLTDDVKRRVRVHADYTDRNIDRCTIHTQRERDTLAVQVKM